MGKPTKQIRPLPSVNLPFIELTIEDAFTLMCGCSQCRSEERVVLIAKASDQQKWLDSGKDDEIYFYLSDRLFKRLTYQCRVSRDSNRLYKRIEREMEDIRIVRACI